MRERERERERWGYLRDGLEVAAMGETWWGEKGEGREDQWPLELSAAEQSLACSVLHAALMYLQHLLFIYMMIIIKNFYLWLFLPLLL